MDNKSGYWWVLFDKPQDISTAHATRQEAEAELIKLRLTSGLRAEVLYEWRPNEDMIMPYVFDFEKKNWEPLPDKAIVIKQSNK